jgi:hypothetical protein
MKKIALTVFILGVITLCAFLTPISRGGTTQRGYYIAESRVEYSNIFNTDGPISVGRFFLFLVVWATICYSVAMLAGEFRKPSNPAP